MIVVGHACGKLITRASFQTSLLLPKPRPRSSESNTEENQSRNILTQTNVFVEEALQIQEVPVIIRKLNDVETICKSTNGKGIAAAQRRSNKSPIGTTRVAEPSVFGKSRSEFVEKTDTKGKSLNGRLDIRTDDGTAVLFCSDPGCVNDTDMERMLERLNSRNSTKGIYSLLEGKIAREINARVALQRLRRIMDLENNLSRNKSLKSGRLDVDIINRDAVLRQLMKIITESQDAETILEGLIALRRDRVSPTRNAYRDRICEEALVRAADGNFTLLQLINIVKILALYKDPKYRSSSDTLWVGIASREQDINADTLVPLFKSLKYFDRSRNIVRIILEKKLSEHWLSLNGSQIADILNCFHDDIAATNCLANASKWASVSTNTSTEKDLINLIRSLNAKGYVDNRISKALEQYVKARGPAIKDSALIASIMNYCKDTRIRNLRIFAECGEYFIKHGLNVPATQLASILTPFGVLDVQPPRSVEFWKTFDQVLSVRLYSLKLNDILDILLSCTYLGRHPVKIADLIFTSDFLRKICQRKDSPSINAAISKLRLLDTAMRIECEKYKGPGFPLTTVSRPGGSLYLDARIRGIANVIYQPLAQIVGAERRISKSVILSRLPPISFYILDIVIHSALPASASKPFFHLNIEQEWNINTVLLIHLPEHYCRNSQYLIGAQAMRKRHIKKLGFRVVSLNYATLEELSWQSVKLSSYLSKRLDSVENAFQ